MATTSGEVRGVAILVESTDTIGCVPALLLSRSQLAVFEGPIPKLKYPPLRALIDLSAEILQSMIGCKKIVWIHVDVVVHKFHS
ncbi:hypothetical protein AFLA_000182 [Aspergillus flavus NRRL3357]|nr:hypothetical protein AFLA_000182 [Aspergillus flavus NRRL3357]